MRARRDEGKEPATCREEACRAAGTPRSAARPPQSPCPQPWGTPGSPSFSVCRALTSCRELGWALPNPTLQHMFIEHLLCAEHGSRCWGRAPCIVHERDNKENREGTSETRQTAVRAGGV